MDILMYAKVVEHQCSNIEELLMRVHDECEVRGYTAAKTIEVAKEVRAWYEQHQAAREQLCKKFSKRKSITFVEGNNIIKVTI